MITDIEAGKTCRVIVKDMSRAGRDYLQTGFYTEVFFRQHGVHFFASQIVWTMKTKQRNLLLDERKAISVWNLAKRQDLAKRIATLAEEIEELRTEKAMLLHSLDCVNDAAMGDVGMFPICSMNTRKSPALSGSGSASTSRNKPRSVRKKKPRSVKTWAAPNQRCCPVFFILFPVPIHQIPVWRRIHPV